MVFWVFVFPILMALALGVAFRTPSVTPVPVAVEAGAGADALVAALRADSSVEVVVIAPDETLATLRDGRAHLVVAPGTPPAYRYDPTRPESRLARLVVDDVLQGAAGRADLWHARDDVVRAPGSRYVDWLIPGLLGMNIMGTGMWGIGFSVVVQRSRKLLKRLIATPMRRARTVEGVSGIMNVVMVPMWIASGVFFASSNFPDELQPFIRALPLTALVDALRGVMLNAATRWRLSASSLASCRRGVGRASRLPCGSSAGAEDASHGRAPAVESFATRRVRHRRREDPLGAPHVGDRVRAGPEADPEPGDKRGPRRRRVEHRRPVDRNPE